MIRKLLCPSEKEEKEEEPKMWKVGNHRVKRCTLKKRIDLDYPPRSDTIESSGYKCVDCEKTRGHRSSFERIDCYEVINR